MDSTINLKTIINDYGVDIFDFDYPFPENHRKDFEEKFIDSYYFYDINFDTVDMFLHRLRAQLLNRLPYYLRLYQTEYMIKNPFENISLKTTMNQVEDKYLLDTEVQNTVEGSNAVTNSHSDFNQDTTENRNKDFTANETTGSNEVETKDKNLTALETTDQTENKDKNTSDGGTETHSVDKSWNETLDESIDGTTSNVNRFADTPQENFVVGDSNPDGSPISIYATTVTYDNGTNSTDTDSTKIHTETGDSDKIDFGKTVDETQNNTINKTVNDTQHTIENNEIDFNKNVDDTANTVEDNTGNTKRQNNDEMTAVKDTQTTKETGSKSYEADKLAMDRDLVGYNNQNLPLRLQQFRDTFINIDKMLIDELAFLFMRVF